MATQRQNLLRATDDCLQPEQVEPTVKPQDTPSIHFLDSQPPAEWQLEAQRRTDFGSSFRDNDAQPITGDWKLIWDDQVDGVMSESHHQCHLRFKQINNTIGGDFVGPVAGRERDALIQGKVVATGSNQLLVFQQHEQGYTCSYQIDLGSGIGTWVDTQGRTGDFQLLKYQ